MLSYKTPQFFFRHSGGLQSPPMVSAACEEKEQEKIDKFKNFQYMFNALEKKVLFYTLNIY